MRTRLALLLAPISMLAAVLLPATAAAMISEIGHTPEPVQATCPSNPCLAVSRTTGFQAKVGADRAAFVVPRDGKIVAWTMTLGKPSRKQINFFNSNEGGASSAGITVLRKGKRLNFRVMAQSPAIPLEPYFGTTAQFALDQSLPVKKGWIVGLTVPTWAPGLAVGASNDTSWRASRPKKMCSDTASQTSQNKVGSVAQYACLYRTARLTYSATLISTP